MLERAANLEDSKRVDKTDEEDDIPLLDDTNLYTIAEALYEVISYSIDSHLASSLEILDNQLLQSVYEDWEGYQKWCRTKSQPWAEDLRAVIMKYRKINFNWQFNDKQWGVLRACCYANQLLLNCLNSRCVVSNVVRREIEETLLLPIAEIEKRKCER